MSSMVLTRRGAFIGFGVLAASALAGCNAPQTGGAPSAISGYRIASIAVDTSPLVAQSGNPTAQWAQDALPGALARVLSSHMAPGDPSGGTLSVVVNSIYLGLGGPGNPDTMKGVVSLAGHQANIQTISVYTPSPADTALPEQTMHNRVNALAQSFAYTVRRKLR